MKHYACCWRFTHIECQFTILNYDKKLTWEFLDSERKLCWPTRLPYKVQIIELTEAEAKSFGDLSDNELASKPIPDEFIQSFTQRYLEGGIRFVFGPEPKKTVN
jgi:hypothetical protein